MITVESKVKIYEIDGHSVNLPLDPTISVLSHADNADYIVFNIDGKRYTTLFKDMLLACQNALNTKYPGAPLGGGVDGPAFNAGRNEGRADVCADLRVILDPEHRHHWNLDGLLNEVKRLVSQERK